MINNKLLSILFLSLFIGFVSCNKDDDDDNNDDNKTEDTLLKPTEAYLMVKNVAGDSLYAIGYYVYSDSAIVSASVEGPGNVDYTLEKDGTDKRFKHLPSDSDFKKDMPTTGEFKFKATVRSKTEEKEFEGTDNLTDEKLTIIEIDNEKFHEGKQKTYWEEVPNANGYRIKLFKQDGTLFFKSKVLATSYREYGFGHLTRGWLFEEKAVDGETYKLELSAIRFEKDYVSKAAETRGFHVQCISFVEKDIVWGD
jgi:hypothetical protein